ncbi:MAG: response regulator [Bacteroidota bacterium]
MLRAVIIDDEHKGQQVLKTMLQKYCTNVEIVALADSATTGKHAIETHNPDIVFLDIEMPFQTGFDLLQSFERIDFKVVFVTAHSQYAVKAIKYNPLDYLLKPINIAELKLTIAKAERTQTIF